MVSMRHDAKGNYYRAYQRGWPVGFSVEDSGTLMKYYINNHLRFTVLFNRDPATDLSRIVGFEVEPFSIKHKYKGEWSKDAQLTVRKPPVAPREQIGTAAGPLSTGPGRAACS